MSKTKTKSKALKYKSKLLSWRGLMFVAVFAIIAAIVIWKTLAATASYTLTVNPANPAQGGSVTFTGTFPQAAFRQSRQPQYPGNPDISLQCSSSTSLVYRQFWFGMFKKDSKNPDGSLNATSYPITLDTTPGASISWPAGQSANCYANTGYWTQDKAGNAVWNPVASLSFYVSP